MLEGNTSQSTALNVVALLPVGMAYGDPA